MEPSKTHGTALPQQKLTHSAGGCPSGPRPEDLMQGGNEGANPHSGQRVAETITNDDKGMNMDMKSLTKLEIYTLLVEKARSNGLKNRPTDLDTDERNMVVLNALFPNGIPNSVDVQNKKIKENLSKFISKCEKLYNDSKRNLKRFRDKNKDWLATNFNIEIPKFENNLRLDVDTLTSETSNFPTKESLNPKNPEPSTSSSITPLLSASTPYDNLSDRQKRRSRKQLEESLEEEPQPKIIRAVSRVLTDTETKEKLKKSSAQELEFVINECLKSPSRSKKIATSIKTKEEPTRPYTPDEALSLIIDRKLTVDDYTFMQRDLKERGFPAYPPYYKVSLAKKMCYPEEDINVTDREASVSFQGLLIHTFRRIIKFRDEFISEYCRQKQIDTVQCIFEGSWGFDGTTGQALYKQKFSDDDDSEDNENCLFATTYIPLYLKTTDGFVLWSNPTPQSFRFCRPLKIQYKKETKELIHQEKTRVEHEIQNLTPIYAETLTGQSIISNPKLHLTIIDGKVLNIILNVTSQLRCSCCDATAKEFNQLDVVKNKPVNPEALRHGLSPLHAWIRIFEFLLHLGYKNDPTVMKWRVTQSSPEAKIVEERKKSIQHEIRDKMGLLVDVVRPNSGTTNDGNTARTAFSDEHRHTFANILGIETWLVDDLHTILVALSSGLTIDAVKFEELCTYVARKYVETYHWFYMSVTLHRILMHGRQIIEASSLPIGVLSEQAGESRNKFWRYDRQHHTRKLDRKTTITDLFHRALESSDPYLSSLTLGTRQKLKSPRPIPTKALRILKETRDNVNINPVVEYSNSVEDIVVLTTNEILVHPDNEDES